MAKKDGWVARADTTIDADTGAATARVEVEALAGWEIDVEIDGVTSGAPVLRSVRLRAPAGKSVTTRALGAVPTGAVLRAVAADVALLAPVAAGDWQASPGWVREVRRWVKGLDTAARTGRAMNPDAFYAQLAVDYEATALASPKATEDMAAKYGVPYNRMKNLLSEATYRGFLVRRRGTAGGHATEAAHKALRNEGTD